MYGLHIANKTSPKMLNYIWNTLLRMYCFMLLLLISDFWKRGEIHCSIGSISVAEKIS